LLLLTTIAAVVFLLWRPPRIETYYEPLAEGTTAGQHWAGNGLRPLRLGTRRLRYVSASRRVLQPAVSCPLHLLHMALKKSELYSSLWSSCDELRGGMDASQYKDYVLVLLFVKYISDRHAGQPYAPITIPPGASFADMVALMALVSMVRVFDGHENRRTG
jgi:hypothetical protein